MRQALWPEYKFSAKSDTDSCFKLKSCRYADTDRDIENISLMQISPTKVFQATLLADDTLFVVLSGVC